MMKRTRFPKPQQSSKEVEEHRPLYFREDEIDAMEVHFVHEYLISLDLVDAATRARLISEHGTKSQRWRRAKAIFDTERVQNYLQKCAREKAARAQVTDEGVINEVAKIAFHNYDKADAFYQDGTPKHMLEMPPEVRHAISEIDYETVYAGTGKNKVKTGYVTKIKFIDKDKDKLQALQTLLKYLGHLSPEGGLKVNYNQFNQYNQQNNNLQINGNVQIDLSDFTEQEVQTALKLLGENDPDDIQQLHDIEQQVQERI